MADNITLLDNTAGCSLVALCTRSHAVISVVQPVRMIRPLRVMNNDVLSNFVRQTLKQSRYGVEYLVQIHTQDLISGNVRHFLIKTAMNENVVINHETRMPESFNVVQPVPIRCVCVVNVQRQRFTHCIVSTTNDQQQSAHKKRTMLVTLCRLLIVSRWSFHPVQPAISVFSETPSIV
jgi:hypothetical protein